MNVKDVINYLREVELNNYAITSYREIGEDIVINCPYHGGGTERTGSFSILTEDKHNAKGVIQAGTGHCFACGTSKSLPQLVQDLSGIETYEQSEEWLKREFNYALGERKAPIMSLLPTVEEHLPKESLEYSQFRVDYHPFFERRGISRRSVEFFELGIDAQFGYAVFPVNEKSGKTRMLFKRSLEGKRFHNTKGAFKEDILFGLDKIYENLLHYSSMPQVWVTESIIDAILLWQKGYLAVAMLQAIPTSQQMELLNNLPFPEIIIATDNDTAGRLGVDKLKTLNKKTYKVKYPDNKKDIGDFELGEEILIEKVSTPKSSIYAGLSLGE